MRMTYKRGGSEDKRIKGRALQKRRLRMYLVDPYCNHCKHMTAHPRGYQIDHIVPLYKGGLDIDENLQLLCIDCHDKKTLEDNRQGRTIGLDGWPID